MRIMTFNLRFENERDGRNAWSHRKELVVEVIQRLAPSILGTQEGTDSQLAYLDSHLPGYRMNAPERPLDETCQYPTLFYREEEFRLLEGGELWLSKTPHLHRSKDWDSAFPRMMNFGLFEHKEAGRRVWAVVTHLDHMGAQAREEQAGIVMRWLADRSDPCILMGDFNDAPDSSVHSLLTSGKKALGDTWQDLDRVESKQSMTHHDFMGEPEKCRMDWILISRDFRVVEACIVRDHRPGRYPSDHFPYLADLEWVGV